MVNIVV